jgi:acetate kinase
MKILVINCGSSSIKFKLFEMPGPDMLAMGIVDRIGQTNAEIRFRKKGGTESTHQQSIKDHHEGIQYILVSLTDELCGCLKSLSDLDAVGHRVAHGGDQFKESTLINDQLCIEIEKYAELAPLHNPINLKGIEAVQKLVPALKQVAVFDTAFHQSLPEYAYMYALPYYFYEKYKIRRYGFHGTSHYFVSKRACEILNADIYKQKIITCHLGNGSSMTAIMEGKSVDTSMGFTPSEGLIMGTRPGDLDVGILPYIMKKENIDCEAVNTILNEESGLLGISGISSDMRDIERSITHKGNARAKLSREMFFYRIRKYIGAYAAVMNGLDILVFTGGIGENCHEISSGLCKGLDFLGIELKDETPGRSAAEEQIISSFQSRVTVMIIPTDEELVIAEETMRLIPVKN